MATRDEIQRVAAAMHALRPEWNPRSLATFLERHQAHRAYGDLAIAAAHVATDPRTKTPELLNQHGPWWRGTTTTDASGPPPVGSPRCPIHPHAPTRCPHCRSEHLAGQGWPDGTHHPDAPKETP